MFTFTILIVLLNFSPNIYVLALTLLASLFYIIFIIVDLIKIASKNKEYKLQPYNRWFVYVGIIFLSIWPNSLLNLLAPENYINPTGSMLNTVQLGDQFFVNESEYGIRKPFSNKYLIWFSKPQRGDVVSYIYPGGRDEIKPKDETKWLKRIIAVPGDTLQISNGHILINGDLYVLPATSIVKSFTETPLKSPDPYIFPINSGWNTDNYGPIIVPKEGDEIKLDVKNLEMWKVFMQREEEIEFETHGYQIFINGKESYTYKVKRNYYFVIGDNWYNSLDSRYTGFVPEDNIIGKVTMIYFSFDPEIPLAQLDKRIASIRWDRIGTIVK